MQIKKIGNIIVIKAENGKMLVSVKDPKVTASEIWLGTGDSKANYLEVPQDIPTTAEEVPTNE